MVADSRDPMSKFVVGIFEDLAIEYRAAMLVKEMDISRLMVYAQKINEEKIKENERENMRARIGHFNFSKGS